MSMPHNRSIPELFSEAFEQLAKLLGNEVALARAELADKASQVGRAAALIGGGALLFMPALVLILFAVAAWLVEAGLSPATAYLVTGVGTAVIGGILAMVGVNRLSGPALRPSMTIEQLNRDQIAAKEMIR